MTDDLIKRANAYVHEARTTLNGVGLEEADMVDALIERVKKLEAEVEGAHAIIADERAAVLWLRGKVRLAYEAQLKAEAALAAAPDVAQAVAEERERCAAKVENMRAHLNYEALLLHMRNTPLPAPLVEQVSIFLDGIAAAIREGKDG